MSLVQKIASYAAKLTPGESIPIDCSRPTAEKVIAMLRERGMVFVTRNHSTLLVRKS